MILQRSKLLALIQSISGLSGYAVSWEHDPQSPVNANDKGQVKLLLRSLQGRGIDEARNTYDPLNDAIVPGRYGLRDLVISVKAESFPNGAEAMEILDRIRSRLYRPSTTSGLNALNLALQTIDACVDLPTEYDNRVVSVASMDVHLTGILSEQDDTANGDFIATVNTTDQVPLLPPALTFSGEAQASASAGALLGFAFSGEADGQASATCLLVIS